MELHHLIPFVMTYALISGVKIPNIDLKMDMKVPSHFLYALSILPMVLLASKGDKFAASEQFAICVSYYLLIKSIMYFLYTSENEEHLFSMGITTISILMLVYTGIIPMDKIFIGYAYIAAKLYITIGSKVSRNDLLFLDIVLGHLIFYFNKRALV